MEPPQSETKTRQEILLRKTRHLEAPQPPTQSLFLFLPWWMTTKTPHCWGGVTTRSQQQGASRRSAQTNPCLINEIPSLSDPACHSSSVFACPWEQNGRKLLRRSKTATAVVGKQSAVIWIHQSIVYTSWLRTNAKNCQRTRLLFQK